MDDDELRRVVDEVAARCAAEAIEEAVDDVVETAGLWWAQVTNEEAVEMADAMIERLQSERATMQADVDTARRN